MYTRISTVVNVSITPSKGDQYSIFLFTIKKTVELKIWRESFFSKLNLNVVTIVKAISRTYQAESKQLSKVMTYGMPENFSVDLFFIILTNIILTNTI